MALASGAAWTFGFARRRVATAAVGAKHFDYLVVGGGSGGMATARRAAQYGAKVCIVDKKRGGEPALGGTCVNVGCVPKKVMWNAGMISEMMKAAPMYNFAPVTPQLDWGALKATRDKYVARLNGIYTRNMDNSGVEYIAGAAEFVGEKAVSVN